MPLPTSRNNREYDKFVDVAGETAVRVSVVGGGGGGGDVNLIQIAGNAVDAGTGNAGTGTQRVVLADDQPVINVNEGGNTTVLSGSVTLTAGPDPLVGVATAARGVVVQNDPTNSNTMQVGSASSQDVILFPGDSVALDIDDLNKVYVLGTATEVANFIGSV